MSTVLTTIFHAGQMRSQTVSPCYPGPHVYLGQTRSLGTLSPSFSTLLPQLRSLHHCCSTTLGEPTTRTSVYLPQSNQPFPSHSLSFASSVLILHGRSLKVLVSYHRGGGSQTEVIDTLSHNIHPGQVFSHHKALACVSLTA